MASGERHDSRFASARLPTALTITERSTVPASRCPGTKTPGEPRHLTGSDVREAKPFFVNVWLHERHLFTPLSRNMNGGGARHLNGKGSDLCVGAVPCGRSDRRVARRTRSTWNREQHARHLHLRQRPARAISCPGISTLRHTATG